MRVGNGNGVSVDEVKDIIAKSRRGSSLRQLIHVALQILRQCRARFRNGNGMQFSLATGRA